MDKDARINIVCYAVLDYLENQTGDASISDQRVEDIRKFIKEKLIESKPSEDISVVIDDLKKTYPELKETIEAKLTDYNLEQKYKIK